MAIIKKYIFWALCTIVFVLILFLGFKMREDTLPSFCINTEFGTEKIEIFDDKNGNYYLFIPAYADLKQISVFCDENHTFALENIILSNEMLCDDFELNKPYIFKRDNEHLATFWFYKSSNIATMYIETVSGDMDYIHENKDHEETVSVTLYTSDGSVKYHNDYSTLKGRGNATWNFDKRPYSLTLPAKADLLGMGSSDAWVLLSNSLDETNLNNYLVYNLAANVGLGWTPECDWIDLYLNGEYSGLYLLTEKIDIESSKLNLNTVAGDFLCKIDIQGRWESIRNPFLTDAGRTVEISFPQALTQSDYSRIIEHVNQMEKTILTFENLNEEPIIDLDTWICRYLIDEISGNVDSDLTSSYFYFSDGVFYAGPVWDYDVSLGNSMRNRDPYSFVAKNAQKSQTYISLYYPSLYKNNFFYDRMILIYRTVFLPQVEKIIEFEIDELSAHISNAAEMNSIRWDSMYDENQTLTSNNNTVRSCDELKKYLRKRLDFLNSAWLDGKDFCTIQFEHTANQPYWCTSVESGTCLQNMYEDIKSITWLDSLTGEIFDFSKPITKDMLLVAKHTPTDSTAAPGYSSFTFATRDYIVIFSSAVLFILLFVFAFFDIRHRYKERRNVDECKRTKISSRD